MTQSNPFKAAADAHYRKGDFELAIDLYSRAVDAKCPQWITCLSNRSAAYYESGNYEAALADSMRLLELTGGTETESNQVTDELRTKHRGRCDRARFFLRAKSQASDGKSAKSSEFLEPGCLLFTKMPGFLFNSQEFYVYGHDTALSALGGVWMSMDDEIKNNSLATWKDDSRTRVNIQELSGRKEPVKVFFGGVGDGRHVLATLVDWGLQKKSSEAKLHLFVNDINATMLARLVVFFVGLYELSQMNVTDWNPKNQQLVDQMVYLVYLYFSAALPPQCYSRLKRTLERLLKEDELSKVAPFIQDLHLQQNIMAVFRTWLDEMDEHLLENVLIDIAIDSRDPIDSSELAELATSSVYSRITEHSALQSENERKMQDYFVDLFVKMFKFRPNAAKQAVKKMLSYRGASDAMLQLPQVATENVLMHVQKLMLLPRNTSFLKKSDNPQVYRACDKLNQSFMALIDPEFPQHMHTYSEWIKDNFNVNPTLFDIASTKESLSDPIFTSPVLLVQQFFGAKSIPSPPKMQTHTFFDYFGFYLVKAARAFAGNQMQFRFVHGDVHRCLYQTTEKFHRVSFSNIPDYTGLLTTFVTCVPKVAAGNSFPGLLASNILYNTSIWEDLDEYIYSSTMLYGQQELKEILGVDVCIDDLWSLNVWSVIHNVPVPPRQKVLRWLYRLFLGIVYPAFRDIRAKFAECSPMTLNMFFATLEFLKDYRRVPAHWLGTVLEKLIQNPILKSSAQVPKRSPNSLPMPGSQRDQFHSYSIAPFQEELKTLYHVWLRTKSDGFQLLSDTSMLLSDVQLFQIDEVFLFPHAGRETVPSLALLFTHESIIDYELAYGSYSNHLYGRIQSLESSGKFHVFSALHRKATDVIQFYASGALMDRLKAEGWRCFFFRSDSYYRLSSDMDVAEVVQRISTS